MQHGTQHEDNGCNIFQKRSGRKIPEDSGVFAIPSVLSQCFTDGIDKDEFEMLEIKMPYSYFTRNMKREYYLEVQLQMEVCIRMCVTSWSAL